MDVRDVERNMDRWFNILQDRLIVRHQAVGERFVENARNNVGTTVYERPVFNKDGSPRKRRPFELTENLRSSIGYSLLTPSGQLQGGFQSGGNKGQSKGKQFAIQEASRVSGDIIISFVAGMEYAAKVESYGYDVITQAAKDAKKDLEKGIKSVLNTAIRNL